MAGNVDAKATMSLDRLRQEVKSEPAQKEILRRLENAQSMTDRIYEEAKIDPELLRLPVGII